MQGSRRKYGTLAGLLWFVLLCSRARSQHTVSVVAHFEGFASMHQEAGIPQGWTTWSPRAEIAPKFSVSATGGRAHRSTLVIGGNGNAAAYGAWRKRVDGVKGGQRYRFTAYYQAQDVPYARRSIIAYLDWLDARGERIRSPDFALDVGQAGGWTKLQYAVEAPPTAGSVNINLALGWCPQGVVAWDEIELVEESAPPQRTVRAMTIYHRPHGTKSAAESVAQFCALLEQSAAQQPDIVCLPEGITVVGTGKSYAAVSEPVPGPTTKQLGAVAQRLHCYIVAGLYERVGPVIYNTAVLIGRDGGLVGSYRKTHLPREETEAGLTAGDAYPVFTTDFGTVGLMICWDVQFPEPARALALQGAEVILLPIWGGNATLAQARAIENHIYLVSSSYDMRTFIVDPTGQVLTEATAPHPVAVAALPLDRVIQQPWLGDMKTRTWKERRPDIAMPR